MTNNTQEQERWRRFLFAKTPTELSFFLRDITNEFSIEPDAFILYLSAQTGKKDKALNEYLSTLTKQQVIEKLKARIPTIRAFNCIIGSISSIIGSLDKQSQNEEDLLIITHNSIKWAKENGASDMSKFYMLLLSDSKFRKRLEAYLAKHQLLIPRETP